jgi:hypothetical protein
VGLSCQELSWPPVVRQSKKYSTPDISDAVVAVIVIEFGPVAAGFDAQVIGLGVGGVVSGGPAMKLVSMVNCTVDEFGSSTIVCISVVSPDFESVI